MKISTNEHTMELLHGDSLKLMNGMEGTPFGAVITDPPYASGDGKLER